MTERDFSIAIQQVLRKYDGTPLLDRWAEATSFGAGEVATNYWIRDSGGLVNAVWINDDGVRDIALLVPADTSELGSYGESMFNFLPFSSIVAVEVRERPNIALEMGLPVPGDKLVQVITKTAPIGTLWWIANSTNELTELDIFLQSVYSEFLARQ